MMKSLKYILLGFAIIFMVSACDQAKENQESAKTALKYTCPMHPQIIEDQPGSCPICSMDLVSVKSQNGKMEIELSENQIKLANIKTLKLGEGDFEGTKVLNGRLVNNPENNNSISSKFPGRVEQLFYKEAGIKISKGQAMFRIYSEELLSLQKDFLLNVKQQNAFPNEAIYKRLTMASKNKLQLYGYSVNQINQLSERNTTHPYLTVYAQESGLITAINISEGQYVTEGTPIFMLQNLNDLWIEAEIYPSELQGLKEGQEIKVSISGFANEPITTKVDFISPQLNAGSQILTLRGSIKNPNDKYQPGMQAAINLSTTQKENKMTLPIAAVLRDEQGEHVWVKTGKGKFISRMVETGEENENSIVVKTGLNYGEEVVVSGAYLLNSEFVLRH
ncbi:MAG: efflux RND transporter periplasmic adaptor subunit [Pelobium sp.]